MCNSMSCNDKPGNLTGKSELQMYVGGSGKHRHSYCQYQRLSLRFLSNGSSPATAATNVPPALCEAHRPVQSLYRTFCCLLYFFKAFYTLLNFSSMCRHQQMTGYQSKDYKEFAVSCLPSVCTQSAPMEDSRIGVSRFFRKKNNF